MQAGEPFDSPTYAEASTRDPEPDAEPTVQATGANAPVGQPQSGSAEMAAPRARHLSGAEGMSTRAIAPIVGAGQRTVVRDVQATEPFDSVEQPQSTVVRDVQATGPFGPVEQPQSGSAEIAAPEELYSSAPVPIRPATVVSLDGRIGLMTRHARALISRISPALTRNHHVLPSQSRLTERFNSSLAHKQ